MFNFFLKSAAVLSVLAATAAAAPASTSQGEVQRICYGESLELHCYSEPDDIPQDVTVADVKFVAAYLRSYGRQIRAGRLFNMKAVDAPDCGEWPLYTRGTVAAYAKHVNNAIDSSVLFEDIANTIDGGSGTVKSAAIVDCLTQGGSFGVQYNASSAAYNTAAYKDGGWKPDGILVKIVSTA
ncbi:hypothetical protein LZ32DRAFT_607699 [Colletotrichum eremochloae]|nr:hypothetical protein LZ32DRAFT_607699 [Colletotrichum eremochloae]